VREKVCVGFLDAPLPMRTQVMGEYAAMMALYPERCHHALFQLPLFKHPRFLESTQLMKTHLENAASPLDTTVEQVLPGVNQNLAAQVHETHELRREQKLFQEETRRNFIALGGKFDNLQGALDGGPVSLLEHVNRFTSSVIEITHS